MSLRSHTHHVLTSMPAFGCCQFNQTTRFNALQTLCISQHGSSNALVYTGPAADASQEEQRNVRATAAFSAPDTLNQFIGEMRELAQALDAQAMLASIPKVFVQYPQVCVCTQQG